jgi:DNA-binding transcriptional LysR family regulator
MYSCRVQAFHAVAKSRSYSQAARNVLHISQLAVSKHVQALERNWALSWCSASGSGLN